MPASLDSIVAATRQRLQRISGGGRDCDLRALEHAAAAHTPRGFRKQLRRVAQDGIAVIIAELKKASPSKG
jgi:indole-3-glycerol phosphate synthase